MQTELGITEEEASRTSYDAYEPNAGLKSITVKPSLEYLINDSWSVLTLVGLASDFSEAVDNPLIDQAGSDLNYEANIFLRWRF